MVNFALLVLNIILSPIRLTNKFQFIEQTDMSKREYIQANKDWLKAKAKEEGIRALPKGIYYKVLADGNVQSATPSVRSIVTAHYTGRRINGKTFDSSRACRLCDLIEGWIIATDLQNTYELGKRLVDKCTAN